MDNVDRLEEIMDRYKDGEEELDQDQIKEMLILAIDAMQNPRNIDSIADDMIHVAGYCTYR